MKFLFLAILCIFLGGSTCSRQSSTVKIDDQFPIESLKLFDMPENKLSSAQQKEVNSILLDIIKKKDLYRYGALLFLLIKIREEINSLAWNNDQNNCKQYATELANPDPSKRHEIQNMVKFTLSIRAYETSKGENLSDDNWYFGIVTILASESLPLSKLITLCDAKDMDNLKEKYVALLIPSLQRILGSHMSLEEIKIRSNLELGDMFEQ